MNTASYAVNDNWMLSGYNNYGLNKTMLTSFAPPYLNLIADDLYRMYGTMPHINDIFELNGQKYLSLAYRQNNTNNLYEYAGFALKLE